MVKEALKAFAFLTKQLKDTRDRPTDSWRNYFELEMLGILFSVITGTQVWNFLSESMQH